MNKEKKYYYPKAGIARLNERLILATPDTNDPVNTHVLTSPIVNWDQDSQVIETENSIYYPLEIPEGKYANHNHISN